MRLLSPAELASPPTAVWRELYDRQRFLDAWQASASWWSPATDRTLLSAEDLIFAGRLAYRLGGPRLSRSLFRSALQADPTNPAVRYYTEHLLQPRYLLLDRLAAFESNPTLDGADTALQADWLASHATIWGRLRNRERASQLIQQAHALHPDSAWLHSVESDLHGMADDWQAALTVAEHAWQLDSASPWAAASLASALLYRGELDEAVRRLEESSANTQSAELLQTACWYRCAAAELLEGEPRRQALEVARTLAARIEPLVPLADREFRAGLARTWLDIAQLAGDRDEMELCAQKARSPFHRKMLANLKQNPAGKRIRLPYRRTLQKHDECVPTSVASALSANGVQIDAAQLAADATFGGTAEWVAADWLRERGPHVRFFEATAELASKLLEAGFAFVTTWEDDDSGHAVAIVGIDHAAGMVLVHDPTAFRTAQYLLGAFDPGLSPLGVMGMVAAGNDRAAELDRLLPPEAAVAEAVQEHRKRLHRGGPVAARAVVAELAAGFPQHPGTQYLQALQDLEEGRMSQALEGLQSLAQRFPRAQRLRAHLMFAYRSLGNTALLRQTLQAIVETGTVPGLKAELEWVRPHARYVADYAELLRQVSETRPQAESLLRSVLRQNGSSAFAWHVLADLRWEQGQRGIALLAYSVASHLAQHEEHYARAYADALAIMHRVEEGQAWLQQRAQRLGGSTQGIGTWTTWIDFLEDHGYPQRALDALESARGRHPAAESLLAYSVPFLARMGQWQQAEEGLQALATAAGAAAYRQAAVSFYRMRGEPQEALAHAESWVADYPRAMPARHALLDLLSLLEGPAAASARAAGWMRNNPANEDFEAEYCNYAQGTHAWRRVRLLRNRVKRNRDDAWAWRELVFQALEVYGQASPARRQRLLPYLQTCLGQAERVSSGSAPTLRAQAWWLEVQSHWRPAIAQYVKALEAEPANFFALRRAWDCAARLPDDERRELWQRMQPLYLQVEQHLQNAPEIAGLLAFRFGVREAEHMVEGWRQQRPNDPNVLEAAADLLLNRGHGRSDAARALELLLAAVERFPYHAGLRFSLAAGHRANGDGAAAEAAFAELVRRRPEDPAALSQLAWLQHAAGKNDEALALLDRAHRQRPQATGPFDDHARMLLAMGRREDAREVIEDLLRSLPAEVSTYTRAVDLFERCRLSAQSVAAARAGVLAFPRGAYLWLLLAKTLQREPDHADPVELSACLDQSLRLNHTYFEAADMKAIALAEQKRFDEAVQLLRALEPTLPDPSPALGRIAWLQRAQGETKQAATAMASVVRDAPWYRWGWARLLAWLEEDKAWPLAQELLAMVPAPLLTDLDFRQSRLQLLRKAGVAEATLDPEWDVLILDFPRDLPLHLRRYDTLWEARRTEEAAQVLRRVLPESAQNSYVLARLVAVESREKNFAEADRLALAVSFAPEEESPWPAEQVWKHMRHACRVNEFAKAFDAELRAGKQPTRRSLQLYAEQLLEGAAAGAGWMRGDLFHGSWLDPDRHRVVALLKLIEASTWRDANYMADLIVALNLKKYRRLVFRCWKYLVAAGLDHGPQSNTRAWAETGLAYVNAGKKRAARLLLADWRTRHGVQMWMVSNYLVALSRVQRLQLAEIVASTRDALERLPHDHTARWTLYMQAEALALLDDRAGLLELWERNPQVFTSTASFGKDEYFPTMRRHLIPDLAYAVGRLQANDRIGFWRARLGLRRKRLWAKDRRIVTWKYFVWFLRAILVLAALSGFLRSLVH